MTVKNLKNLKYLNKCYILDIRKEIDPTFLSNLEQLKEIHLYERRSVPQLFEQKRRDGRTDLKIFYLGLLLNGPDDPTVSRAYGFDQNIVHLAENPSRMADEILLYKRLSYTAIERVTSELAVNVANRFIDLDQISVSGPVQDIERFLNLLKNLDNIVHLDFSCNQPQDLFDRLPEHCAIQLLFIASALSDFRFLSRLKHLICLSLNCSIDAGLIRKILEENDFLSMFGFKYINKAIQIRVEQPKRFKVWIDRAETNVPDLNAAIQLIAGIARQKDRNAEDLLE